MFIGIHVVMSHHFLQYKINLVFPLQSAYGCSRSCPRYGSQVQPVSTLSPSKGYTHTEHQASASAAAAAAASRWASDWVHGNALWSLKISPPPLFSSVTMYFNGIQSDAHLDDAADAWHSVWVPLNRHTCNTSPMTPSTTSIAMI